MNKIIFSIICSVFFIVLTVGNVFACTCRLPDSHESIENQVRESFEKSSTVFVGEVIEAIEEHNIQSVTVKFRVEKTWNKKLQSEITLTTSLNSAVCGYTFEVGKKYLVYAFGDAYLTTNICTRTASAEANKDIVFLDRVRKPKIKSSPK